MRLLQSLKLVAGFLKFQFVEKVKAGVEFRHVQGLNRSLPGGCAPLEHQGPMPSAQRTEANNKLNAAARVTCSCSQTLSLTLCSDWKGCFISDPSDP